MTSDQNSFPMPILLDDEPVTESILFDFDKKAEDLADIVSIERQTPFAILLNGEWGSGKTSLMKIMQKKIENNKPNKNKKVIWFNAWQYEGLDPRSALLVKIVQKCQSKSENAIDKIIKSIPNFNIGLNLGVFLINTDSRDIIEQYIDNTDRIENLHRYLEEDIIKGNKLFVFIDDLDRCSVENALNILESIKIFLSTKNTTFIVGADLEKLEKAWELRYGKRNMTHMHEAKNHIDKIFQLSISLPVKDHTNMQEYMNSLAQNDGFLNTSMKQLILFGCKANPRSFKRILNLINILWFFAKKYDLSQNDIKLILTSLSIISVQYPQLLRWIKSDQIAFFELAFLAIKYNKHSNLKKYEKELTKIDHSNVDRKVSPTQLRTERGIHGIKDISIYTLKGLEYLAENEFAFGLMRTLGMNFNYSDAQDERLQHISQEKQKEIENLKKLLNSISLFI